MRLQLRDDMGRWPWWKARRALTYARWWLQAVRHDGWRDARCGWCKVRPTMHDDCGFWYIAPYGHDGDVCGFKGSANGLPCCNRCWNGPLGDMHRARYGVGER